MRVLIPIFFNAPMGGLHHHVLASTGALLAAGHEVVVVSKSGPFAEAVRALGASHIETDWSEEDAAATVAKACEVDPDIVYCHPFASRQLGVAVAEALAVPLVAVWHGMYEDFANDWAASAERVIAVSDGVADYLRERCPALGERLVVIPNGVDEQWQRVPQPTTPAGDARRTDSGAEFVNIGFVCRLDEDKQFIIDVFAGAVADDALACRDDVVWHIIGDGEGRDALASELDAAGVHTAIRWHGWLDTPAMTAVMADCDIIIAPGRSALEAMALGRATIAVGSKHYAGVVGPDTWRAIAATNFGGIGTRFEEYSHGTLAADLAGLIDDAPRRRRLGEFGADLIDERFRDSVAQQRLLNVLAEAGAQGKTALVDLRVAYAQQRARALRVREEAVLTYRRYSRSARETAAKHEAKVEQLTEAIARRDATLAAIKRNPLRLLTMAARKAVRRHSS